KRDWSSDVCSSDLRWPNLLHDDVACAQSYFQRWFLYRIASAVADLAVVQWHAGLVGGYLHRLTRHQNPLPVDPWHYHAAARSHRGVCDDDLLDGDAAMSLHHFGRVARLLILCRYRWWLQLSMR